jgi:hypothetical protein
VTRQLVVRPLSSVKTRRVEWIYQDRIPLRTGTILAGMGGIAKSTIISDIIGRATTGTLPGSFQGTPINVGIISPEDDLDSVLVPRLIAAGADLTCVKDLSTVVIDSDKERGWTTLPNIQEDLPALGDAIRQNDIRLLVVDPLVSIMVGNSISQSDVRRNFDPLSSLASELGFALLAVAHFGKSGEKAGDRLSGSHAFRDVARSLMVCAVDEETDQRIVTVEKSNYSPVQPSDAYEIESATIVLDDGFEQSIGRAVLIGSSQLTVQDLLDRERDVSKYSDDSQRFIAYVNAHPDGVRAEDVASLADGDLSKARRYLNRAAGRGDIERLSRGVFRPVSRVPSVPSVPNSGHIGHIRHKSSLEQCPVCGESLAPALVAAGETSHPGCEVAA